MQEKHKKTSENAGTQDNFRAFTERWTPESMRFLELSWICRFGKYKKTGENITGTRSVFRTFTERWILENRTFCEISGHLPFWKTKENAGFQLLTPDERDVLRPENIREHRQTRHSPSVNRPVNSRKRMFSGVHRNGKLPDNGTNTRIHPQQNNWKILDFPIGEHKWM